MVGHTRLVRPLTQAEHDALSARIRAAEARTMGEIYCVVARVSDSYIHPALAMVGIGAVAANLAVALWLDRSWLDISLTTLALCQAAAYAATALLLWLFPRLRMHLVPHHLRERRAHDNAVKQFLAHNVHMTERRTGILIFVSLAERHAEVVADPGINEKVRQEDWNGIVAGIVSEAGDGRFVAGLEHAIDQAGSLLALHFPGGRDNPNELDDHVVEI